jgi:hypothetical protein
MMKKRLIEVENPVKKAGFFHFSPASPWPAAASSIWRRYSWL